jgi:polyhydroxyalkanoate synthesis regulator phasin
VGFFNSQNAKNTVDELLEQFRDEVSDDAFVIKTKLEAILAELLTKAASNDLINQEIVKAKEAIAKFSAATLIVDLPNP